MWLTQAITFNIHALSANEVFWGFSWKEFLGVMIVSFLWPLQFFWGVRWKISKIWGVFCVGTLIFFFEGFKISPHLPLRNYPKSSAVQKNRNKYVPFLFFSPFRVIFTATIILWNCDKISCRKIVLNSGFLSLKFIYICNLSSFLQLLALNKAYYLKIKVGFIIASRQNLLNFAAILELLWNFQISTAIPSEIRP